MMRAENIRVSGTRDMLFPAPTKGWVQSGNITTAGPDQAEVLDNMFPTAQGARLRGGSSVYANIGEAVVQLMVYSATEDDLFAATATGIYDAGRIASGGDNFADVSGLTSGDWSYATMTTAGGTFNVMVNGSDTAQLYNGTEHVPVNAAAINNLPYTYPSAPWEVGQVITGGTSGASATIVGITQTSDVTGTLRLGAITAGPFASGEDITSTTSSLAIGRNLAIRSQELDNATWTKTRTTVTADATTAPDGTTTADKVVETAASGTHTIRQAVTVAANTTHTFTAFVKGSERTNGVIRMDSGADDVAGNFQLSAGTITGSVSGLGSGVVVSIEELPASWWRIRVSGIVNPTATSIDCTLTIRDNSNTASYLGDGTSGLFYWGAQLEVGANITPYEKTAAAVRTNMVSVTTAASSSGSAVTITGVTTADLNQVWSHKRRLFFVEKNSMSIWYLPVVSVGGAATEFPLGAIFKRGGTISFGASWSLDSGSGLDDVCIIVTSNGEIAVYQGTDPSVAIDWTLVGVYEISRPLNKSAYFKAGGDLAILTEDGIIPVSEALRKDRAALQAVAISYPIEDAWKSAVANRSTEFPIQPTLWQSQALLMIGVPGSGGLAYVANARTGAWCRYTGWDVRCGAVANDLLYFGTNAGNVMRGQSGGSDNGTEYTGRYVPKFTEAGISQTKVANFAGVTVKATENPNFRMACFANYEIGAFPNATALNAESGDVWGTGVWGTFVWGTGAAEYAFTVWKGVRAVGYSLAPAVVVTSNQSSVPAFEILATRMRFEIAGPL
jgi:hypothetical protein